MKVLHILNDLSASGAETMLELAAPYWIMEGVDLSILSTGREIGAFAPRLSTAGYRVMHEPFRRSTTFARAISEIIAAGKYDVVHIHTERANVLYGLAARRHGTRTIVRTIHNVFEFRGRLRITRALERRLLSELGVAHVAIGSSVVQNEQSRFHNSTICVPNWYDAETYRYPTVDERKSARNQLDIAGDLPVIVSVGNCSPVKNHAALLLALALVNERGATEFVYLHLGKETSDRDEYALAENLGLKQRSRFLGQQPPHTFLWAADLFVMPSLHEGFSIAALEALATGLPSVLTNCPGLRDLAALDLPIYWADSPSPDALFHAITTALANSARSPIIEHDGQRQEQLNQFRPEVGARAYLDLYESRSRNA